jgi:hypothetical protein
MAAVALGGRKLTAVALGGRKLTEAGSAKMQKCIIALFHYFASGLGQLPAPKGHRGQLPAPKGHCRHFQRHCDQLPAPKGVLMIFYPKLVLFWPLKLCLRSYGFVCVSSKA